MMKYQLFSGSSGSSQADLDGQIREAVTDVIRESNDKIVEIRPANESSGQGRGKLPLMLLIAGVAAVGYWLRKTENPTEKLRSAAGETADRTKEMTDQAAETIQESGETVSERVEEKTQKAGEEVQRTGETVSERVEEKTQKAGEEVQRTGETVGERVEEGSEEAGEQVKRTGENAAEKTERAGDKTAEKAEDDDDSSDGPGSSGRSR